MRTAASAGAACCLAALMLARPVSAQENIVEEEVEIVETPQGELSAVELEVEVEPQPWTEQQRNTLVAYRTLQLTTVLSMAATAVFGAIQAYNLPTLFGHGECVEAGYDYGQFADDDYNPGEYDVAPGQENDEGDPIFGDYACRNGLSVVHGALGVATALLYTTTDVMSFFAPDPDRDDNGAVDTFKWISTIGLALTAVAGLVGANPYNFLSIDADEQYDFERTVRTIHMGLAGVSAASYLTSVAIDWF